MSKYNNIKLDPYGAVFDTNPHDVGDDVWTDSLNMRFNDNAAEKIGGEVEGDTTTAQATHLLFNGNHTDPYWLYFGDAIARVTNFTTDKDIEGSALSSGINWDSSLFNTFPICNNTLDVPRYWDNDFATPGTLADLPAWTVNHLCQSIRPFRSFLVAMNITVTGTGTEPNRVLWSTSSDAGALPASWDITDPSTLAGDAYLTDDKGEIIDGAQLRDMFVIYKTHSTYLMRFIGGQSVMRIDKVQVNSGLLAKNCIVEFKGRHFVVADGDIVLFDGQNVESIADKRVKDTIFNNIDSENFDNTYVVRDDKHNEIWVCYPSSGQTYSDKAAIWNWEDNTWTFRELTNTRHIAPGVSNFASSPTWDSLTTETWDTYNSTWKSFSSNPTVDTLLAASSTDSVEHSTDTGFDEPSKWTTTGTASVTGSQCILPASSSATSNSVRAIKPSTEYIITIDAPSISGSIIALLGGEVTIPGITATGSTTVTSNATISSPLEIGISAGGLASATLNSMSITLSSVDTLNIIGDTFDILGTAMPSKLEKLTMDLGSPDEIKMVKSVTPRITADAGTKIYIRVGTQFNPDDNVTWGTEQLYTVGTDREAYFTQKGRYISIRMRTQDIGANWKCHGFYFKAAISGKH